MREGVSIAVVDSGVNAAHPHVGGLRGGRAFLLDRDGRIVESDDLADRIGHGTACAAVIRELHPAAGILAVKVFDRELTASVAALARGIRWAIGKGARLLSLSLAVAPESGAAAADLDRALAEAREAGAAIIAARPPPGPAFSRSPLLGSDGVILAGADPDCPPDRLRLGSGAGAAPGLFLLASPFARAAPGVPRHQNFQGPSFAAARVCGFAARILDRASGGPGERGETPLSAGDLRGALEALARIIPGGAAGVPPPHE